ncbi:MAG TPA: extracellular solute-binding protein [Acidimicrobiales bacterium]|nr:extracellular solute-binding protein [Acidimicrobiales bacterium]
MTCRPHRFVALGLAGALAAAACSTSTPHTHPLVEGPTTTAAPTCTVERPAATRGTVTINVSESFDTRSEEAASLLVGQFNASQKQIVVVLQHRSSDDSVEQQLTRPGGPPSAPTLAVLDDIRTQALADSGKVLPAALCFEAAHADLSNFMPSARSYYTVGDKLLAASANLTAPLLYFDRTSFRKAGLDPSKPPTTLDQVYRDALKLKQANPTTLPLAMKMSSWLVESWLTGAGNAIVNNDNGRSAPADGATFNSTNAVAVHKWLQKMYAADLIDLVPDTPGEHAQDVDLATRRSAMLIDSSAVIGDVDALEFDTLDPTVWGLPATTALPPPGPTLDIDVAPLPGLSQAGRGQVSGSAWYLSAAASPAQQAAAWTFMTWWNQPAQQVAWSLEGSYLPFNNVAVGNDQLQQVWQHTRRGRWLDTAYTQITNVDTQSPGPLIGPYSAVRAAIVQSMSAVTRGDMDPAITVNETDSTIDADLIEYQLAHA